MLKPILTPRDIAERYNRFLPEEVRSHLKGRGIPSTLIDDHLLGWDCRRITIPVFDRAKEVIAFRYASLPKDPSAAPVMAADEENAEALLYGAEVLARQPHRVVICEGEFDALVLRAKGVPAVCSTGGAFAFPKDWAAAFAHIPDVYICVSGGSPGEKAARAVQRILPAARIARLPSDVGETGTISDYFLLGRELRDFELVLAGSEPAVPDPADLPPRITVFRPADKSQRTRAEKVRKRAPLQDVVWHVTNLQASGGRLVGHCPFHNDDSRSFTVYPRAGIYRCSACGAEGDVVRFVMDTEVMTFGQAIEALERFEITHELYGTGS